MATTDPIVLLEELKNTTLALRQANDLLEPYVRADVLLKSLQKLQPLWVRLVKLGEHKESDLKWVIETVCNEDGALTFKAKHRGTVYQDVLVECESYLEAAIVLRGEMQIAFSQQFEWAEEAAQTERSDLAVKILGIRNEYLDAIKLDLYDEMNRKLEANKGPRP